MGNVFSLIIPVYDPLEDAIEEEVGSIPRRPEYEVQMWDGDPKFVCGKGCSHSFDRLPPSFLSRRFVWVI